MKNTLDPPLAATPPDARPRRRPGFAGMLALGAWLLAGLSLLAYLAAAWNSDLFARYAPIYLSGLWTTIQLVAISFVVGALISVPVALGRGSKGFVQRDLSTAYVVLFRGTPFIAQLFLIYYGFGQFRDFFESIGLWRFFREPWYCAIFALALNTAAYQAEILRGAVASVPKGQWEGAKSLGLSRLTMLRKVILPQAAVVALRPYTNEVILMVKASAIVAIITVYDLLGETRRAYSRTFDFQTYLWAAILYLLIVELLRHATNFAERRLTRHLRR